MRLHKRETKRCSSFLHEIPVKQLLPKVSTCFLMKPRVLDKPLFYKYSVSMSYTPSDTILKKYADVLVNFALGMGKGIKKGDVVRLSANESAKPLFMAVCNAIVDAGGHVLSHYAPDKENGDMPRNASRSRYFYQNASDEQIKFFPGKYLKGVV